MGKHWIMGPGSVAWPADAMWRIRFTARARPDSWQNHFWWRVSWVKKDRLDNWNDGGFWKKVWKKDPVCFTSFTTEEVFATKWTKNWNKQGDPSIGGGDGWIWERCGTRWPLD